MAINPESQYPGKITPATAAFPYGSARNVTVPGDGTGTPWEAALLNDIFGFQQALLGEAAIVPSGTPDEVGASQYLTALKAVSDARVLAGREYVTPEQFGTLSANDNQLFIDAIAAGKPVLALGTVYNVSKVISTSSAVIIFGRNTRIVNGQTSGPKEPSFLFQGNKDVTEVDVTAISSDYLKDTITVADASGFSVGDTVLLQENEPLVPEIDYGQGALFQDANYREFSTILAINGNDITFEEYLRFPYQTANSLKLQKVNFLEDVHVAGGIFEGGNGGGGGVNLTLCRYSSVTQVKGRGLSELDRNGGSVCKFEECWESHRDAHDSKWTLFGAHSVKNQSCTFGTMQSKRTSNGGLIVSGDRFCSFATVVQDSTGDDNGDGVGLSNGARNNSFGTINCSGSRCYGMWWHPTCDDNTVESFSSDVGITLVLYLFGDRNKFGIVKGRNHPTGVAIYGNDNEIVSGDIVTEGTALQLTADDTVGNKIQGQFISTGVAANSYDLIIGNVVNTDVHIRGGARGINYAVGKVPNHDNTIFIDGPNPYVLAIDKHTKGYTWSNREVNVNATARDLQVPVQGQPQGLGALDSTVSGDAAKVYRISIKTESTIADTYSEYYVINRQSVMQITPLIEGASSFAPRLSLSGNIVQIATNGGGNISMVVNVDQY